MIQISENIQLKKIQNTDCELLFTLMKEVYPLAYSHFWTDKGKWYVNTQYSKENILKELSQDFEINLIKQALSDSQYNQKKTAEKLGLTYHQLRGYLKKYNLLEQTSDDLD